MSKTKSTWKVESSITNGISQTTYFSKIDGVSVLILDDQKFGVVLCVNGYQSKWSTVEDAKQAAPNIIKNNIGIYLNNSI